VNLRSRKVVAPVLVLLVLLIGAISFILVRSGQSSTASSTGGQPVQWVSIPAMPTAAPGVYVFRTVAGGLVANPSPASGTLPSLELTFSPASDGYAIRYPESWLKKPGTTSGHQSLTIYPPGSSLSTNVPGGSPGISIGWTTSSPLLDPHDSALTDMGTIVAGNVQGHLFTVGGAMGHVVTAYFPAHGGYVVLSGDADSNTLLGTFEHMLSTVTLS